MTLDFACTASSDKIIIKEKRTRKAVAVGLYSKGASESTRRFHNSHFPNMVFFGGVGVVSKHL